MLKIGVTGGIGSGKSFICRIIETFGYPVFYADAEAKKLVSTNIELIRELEKVSGKTLWTNNTFDKGALAESIFSSEEMRLKVNSIVHPYVHRAFNQFCKESKSNLVFEEAAIILESGNVNKLDKIILVSAPLELRVSRVKQRDNASTEQIMARVAAQMSDEEKIKLSDYVILNDEKSPLLVQITNLIDSLKNNFTD